MQNDNANVRHERLIIVGSGPAGYTAAVYAARAGLKPVVVTGMEPGGQLTTTSDVENWPADPQGVVGPALMERFKAHAERFGAEIVYDNIEQADLKNRPFRLRGSSALYLADCVIVATGASAKYLGIKGESELRGRGVSACATCDGFFYKNKPAAVIGGGNTAAQEALYLANLCSKVYLVHRRDAFRCERIMVKQLDEKRDEGKIEYVLNATPEEVLGDAKGVTGLKVKLQDGSMRDLPVDGVFVAIGHKPNSDVFAGQLELDDAGYIVTQKGRGADAGRTSVEGVFAAGDVQDPIYRQAVTSAAAGCQAALDAERWLAKQKS